jgi:hypothetical protein
MKLIRRDERFPGLRVEEFEQSSNIIGVYEGYSRIEAGMGLGIVKVDMNNVRVGSNLGVNVQNAIAMKLDPSRSARQ